MKKFIIIALVLISMASYSQLVMEPKIVLRSVGSEWKFIKIYENFVTEPVPVEQDSVIYSFDAIPYGISERILKDGYEQIGDTVYKYSKRVRIDLSYGRRLVLYQYVNKMVYLNESRSDEEKMYFYVEKAYEFDVSNDFFYNYPAVDSLLHPIIEEEVE